LAFAAGHLYFPPAVTWLARHWIVIVLLGAYAAMLVWHAREGTAARAAWPTMKLIVEPRQLSRFYALRDGAAVRPGFWVATLAFLVVYALLVPIGLYARAILPGDLADSDRVVPLLLNDRAIFHPAASAYMLVALVRRCRRWTACSW
jgi:hypothetical protein